MKLCELEAYQGRHTLVYASNNLICTGVLTTHIHDRKDMVRLTEKTGDRIIPLSSVNYVIEAPEHLVIH